jgi:predicted O-linked N-acetylglucosamine transferase (SPINDLY family)
MMRSDSSSDPASTSLDERLAQAVQYQLAGQLDRAEQIYRAILDAQPRHAGANHCIGMLQVHSKRPADGLPYLFAALQTNPEVPDYWLGYLEALLLAGQIASANTALALARQHGLTGAEVEEFAQRLANQPPAGLKSLGAARSSDAADRVFAPPPTHTTKKARTEQRREDRLVKRQEDEIEGFLKRGRFDKALTLAQSMTKDFPECGVGWKVLGALLWAKDNFADAVAAMETSVRLLPEDAEAHTNLGAALLKVERFTEAEAWLRIAVQIDPEFVSAHLHLGNLCQLQGRYAEAEASLRCATAVQSGGIDLDRDMRYSGLLFVLSHNPAVDANTLFAEHCRVGAILEADLRDSRPSHLNSREPDRALRVGWVSGDLYDHALASFIEPVLAQLRNHASLELYAYYNHTVEDKVTRRLKEYFAQWNQVTTLSDVQLAKKITDDRIDVLIDLSGHTTRNRLRTFARKPAPIQASWMGYPGTTGLKAMDYYLADRYFLPPGPLDAQFTEKILRIPAVPFQGSVFAPPVNVLPALANGSLTFGSFNRLGKINPVTVALWSELLRAVPDSRMLIAGLPRDGRDQRLIGQFTDAGIAHERLVVHHRESMDRYLALHHEVDICLDTYPYCGGTTTLHAVWMGVPTLTVAGPTPASRQGAAILGQIGLDEFVAANAADFVAKGRYWATHLTALSEIRATLRHRWQQSPAHKPQVIAAGIEQAIRRMWGNWCANLPAESFSLPDP